MKCLGSNTGLQNRENESSCLEQKCPFHNPKHRLLYEDVTSLTAEVVVLFSSIT